MIKKCIKLNREDYINYQLSTLFVVESDVFSGDSLTQEIICLGHDSIDEDILNNFNFYKLLEYAGKFTLEYIVCTQEILNIANLHEASPFIIQIKIYNKDSDCINSVVQMSDNIKNLLMVLYNKEAIDNFNLINLYEHIAMDMIAFLFMHYDSIRDIPNSTLTKLINTINTEISINGNREAIVHIDEMLPLIFNRSGLYHELFYKAKTGMLNTGDILKLIYDLVWPKNFPYEEKDLISTNAFKLLTRSKTINQQLIYLSVDRGCTFEEECSSKKDKELDDYTVYKNPHLSSTENMVDGLRYSYLSPISYINEMQFTDIILNVRYSNNTNDIKILELSNKSTGWKIKNSKKKSINSNKLITYEKEFHYLVNLLDEISKGFNIIIHSDTVVDVIIRKDNNEELYLYYHIKDSNDKSIFKACIHIDLMLGYILSPNIVVKPKDSYNYLTTRDSLYRMQV